MATIHGKSSDNGPGKAEAPLITISPRETKDNLFAYQQRLTRATCEKYKFPRPVASPYLSLRKNTEIVLFVSELSSWDEKVILQSGKKHIYQEYYPVFNDIAQQDTVPCKEQDYRCNIMYHHLFPPSYHQQKLFSFSVSIFERSIFKHIDPQYSGLEQKITARFAAYFQEQNKRGPRQVMVSVVDNQFLVILVAGVLTPFLKRYGETHPSHESLIENLFMQLAQDCLQHVVVECIGTKPGNAFIHFDKNGDKLVVLAFLDEAKQKQFFDEMES